MTINENKKKGNKRKEKSNKETNVTTITA